MEKFQPRASSKIPISECEEIQDDKYDVLREIFEENKLNTNDMISKKDLWFWKDHESEESVHQFIWNSVVDPKTEKIKVDQYIVELIYCMNNLSSRIEKISERKGEFEKRIKELNDTLKQLNDNDSKYDHRGQKLALSNDTINVSYISSDRRSYNLLGSQHRLVFRAGINEDDGKIIGEAGDMVDACRIKVNENVDSLKIKVFALINKKEDQLSLKNLPTEEIYTSFDSNLFTEKEIPPIFLIIPYETDSDLAESKEVELRFELKFTYELRVKVIEKLIKRGESQLSRIQLKEDEAQKHLIELLEPFSEKLKYKPQDGFKVVTKKRACESCSIF